MSAKLIMFDGPDGVGKTTQIQLLADHLQGIGQKVLVTRIVGGSPIGEALRPIYLGDYPRPAATNHYLARAIYAAFTQELDTQRERYDTILVDRSPLSNIAYQGYGNGYDKQETIKTAQETLEALRPDLIIYYSAPLQQLRKQLQQVNTGKYDYFEAQPDTFFEKVIAGYEYGIEQFGAVNIDATGSVEAVQQATLQHVEKLL